jgi:hypothetical protein
VSPDLCKVGNLCSLEAEADISNGHLLVQEMLRLVRDLVSPDLCKVGNLCSLEAESPVSLSALPQEDIQCKFRISC